MLHVYGQCMSGTEKHTNTNANMNPVFKNDKTVLGSHEYVHTSTYVCMYIF